LIVKEQYLSVSARIEKPNYHKFWPDIVDSV